VEGPQTTGNGGIANKPLTTRSDEGWGRSLAGANDDPLRFGMISSCGGVRRTKESDQKAYCQDRTHCIFSNRYPHSQVVI
jgi:hypothetical protein